MSRKWLWFTLGLLAVMVVSIAPVAAQSGIVWNSEFFNNNTLFGRSIAQRQDNAVAFDWGSGSPQSGINADNFSARFGTDPFFSQGTYRFWALADDQVKVWVDYARTPLIDTFTNPSVAKIVSADIQMAQGVHHIQVDYAEQAGNAYVYVTWANLASNPSGPNFPPLNNSNPVPVSGPWTSQYFANPSLFGSPALIQSEPSPSHDWGYGSPTASVPADNFSARWTSVQNMQGGTYQMTVKADDGVRVAVDNIYYLNEWHSAVAQTYNVTVPLSPGQHTFLIEYYEATGVAFMNFNFGLLGAGGGVATAVPTAPPTVPIGAYITVTGAYKLNVRATPDPINGAILTKINRLETYPILGRNSNTTWWQINVNGIIGWVNARFVTAFNATGVPINNGGGVVIPTPIPTQVALNCSSAPAPRLVAGRYGRVTPGLPNNIRTQPDSNAALIGQIPPGSIFAVLSNATCSSGLYWYQVNYNGVVGWTPEGGSGQYWVEPL